MRNELIDMGFVKLNNMGIYADQIIAYELEKIHVPFDGVVPESSEFILRVYTIDRDFSIPCYDEEEARKFIDLIDIAKIKLNRLLNEGE